jgi:putative GTP pyrophosphokinase
MENDAIESVREKYIAEQPLYQEFAEYIHSLLVQETRERGIKCTVEARSKEIYSLLKKALRKQYASPYEQIKDKAGARVIVNYSATLAQVENIVHELFEVHNHENKSSDLGYSELGYLGIHLEVSLASQMVHGETEKFRELICEIQLHTKAQNLWANISHELLYKSIQNPPGNIQRNIYRLMALVEIFDNEVENSRKTILEHPNFLQAQILDQLEQQFYRLTARPFDRELSFQLIKNLEAIIDPGEIENFGNLIREFVDRNDHKLKQIFEDYASDPHCSPLLFQPEVLLIFERLEKDEFKLKDSWIKILPLSLLESLASIWGESVSTD